MTEQSMICKFSEVALQQARRQLLALMLLIPAGMIAMFLWIPSLRSRVDWTTVCILIPILLLIEVVLIVEANYILRKRRETVLSISPFGLVRSGGKFSEEILYEDIRLVEIIKFPSGEVTEIRLKMDNQRSLALQGFDCMESIIAKLEDNTYGKAIIQEKRLAVNWNHPITLVMIFAMILTGYLIAERWIISTHHIIPMVISFGYGMYSLINRPLTQRMGKRFGKFEVILGVGLILSGLATLLLLFVEAR